MARKAIKEEGILIGGSSGLALCGAIKFCKNLSEDKRVVVFNLESEFWCDKEYFFIFVVFCFLLSLLLLFILFLSLLEFLIVKIFKQLFLNIFEWLFPL